MKYRFSYGAEPEGKVALLRGKTHANDKCDRCGGAGGADDPRWLRYDPGGVPGNCFKCLGKGRLPRRVYNEKEYAALERARAKRAEKLDAAREARLDAERDRNGGLTNAEAWEKRAAEGVEAEEKKRAPLIKLLTPLADDLWDGRHGFCDSMAGDLRKGHPPRGRGVELVCEIIAKHHGRRGSKAYEAEFDRIEAVLEKAKKIDEGG